MTALLAIYAAGAAIWWGILATVSPRHAWWSWAPFAALWPISAPLILTTWIRGK
jgi:hypothetical protein